MVQPEYRSKMSMGVPSRNVHEYGLTGDPLSESVNNLGEVIYINSAGRRITIKKIQAIKSLCQFGNIMARYHAKFEYGVIIPEVFYGAKPEQTRNVGVDEHILLLWCRVHIRLLHPVI
jgi:hypothetical protein